jgi:hypothetical protein
VCEKGVKIDALKPASNADSKIGFALCEKHLVSATGLLELNPMSAVIFSKWGCRMKGPFPAVLMLTLLLSGLGCATFAQTAYEYSVNVTDVSGSNSPIAISDTAFLFKERTYPDHVEQEWVMQTQLTNVSSKVIMAYEVSVEAVPKFGGRTSNIQRGDQFFEEHVTLVPGAIIPLDIDGNCQLWGNYSSQRGDTPKAELKVRFVQFDDGSTFGTSDWGTKLSDSRFAAMQRLNELLEAYYTGGSNALTETIAQDLKNHGPFQPALGVLRSLDYHLENEGAAAILPRITGMLRAAQERQKIM